METLLVNLSGTTRRETVDGREYLVAPMTMIVPGVLNGSKGALYYPPEEISRNVDAWNGMPMYEGHPTDPITNSPVRGRSPSLLSKELGRVYNATTRPDGSLVAEGWFDVQNTKRLSPRIYRALSTNSPIGLSTGLYTDNHPTRNGRCPRTQKPYDAIARNYRPDHLAILVDAKGACSLADGCGVGVRNEELPPGIESWLGDLEAYLYLEGYTANSVNQVRSQVTGYFKKHGAGSGKGDAHEGAQRGAMVLTDEDRQLGRDAQAQLEATGHNPASWVEDEDLWERAKAAADKGDYDKEDGTYYAVVTKIYKNMGGAIKAGKTDNRDFSADEREKLADSGAAMDDGSFPVKTSADLHNAVQSVGRAKDPGAARAHIIRRAKALGLTEELPEDWTSNSDPNGGYAEEETVMPDPKKPELVSFLTTNCDCWKGQEKTLNGMDEPQLKKLKSAVENARANELVVNSLRTDLGIGAEVALNEFPAAVKKKVAPEDEETPAPEKDMPMGGKTCNEFTPEQQASIQNNLAKSMGFDSFDHMKATLNVAKQVEHDTKLSLVRKLVANVADEKRRQAIGNDLMKKDLGELRTMVELLPPVKNAAAPPAPVAQPEPIYFGSAPETPTTNRPKTGKPLALPRMKVGSNN